MQSEPKQIEEIGRLTTAMAVVATLSFFVVAVFLSAMPENRKPPAIPGGFMVQCTTDSDCAKLSAWLTMNGYDH